MATDLGDALLGLCLSTVENISKFWDLGTYMAFRTSA